MTLVTELKDELLSLQSGQQINRKRVIDLFQAVLSKFSEVTTTTLTPSEAVEYTPRKEATPVRFPAKNWGMSACKRCGSSDAPDGVMIVRIYGVGWWHDACYRKVNPDFYEGM